MDLDIQILARMKDNGLTLEEWFIIYSKVLSNGWTVVYRNEEAYFKLQEKQLLNKRLEITPKARELYDTIYGAHQLIEDQFGKWWKTWPKDDELPDHKPTRDLRIGRKDDIRRTYEQIVKNTPPTTLQEALEKEIKWRTENSNLKENKLTYIKGPKRWLTEEAWEIDYTKKKTFNNYGNYGKEIL